MAPRHQLDPAAKARIGRSLITHLGADPFPEGRVHSIGVTSWASSTMMCSMEPSLGGLATSHVRGEQRRLRPERQGGLIRWQAI